MRLRWTIAALMIAASTSFDAADPAKAGKATGTLTVGQTFKECRNWPDMPEMIVVPPGPSSWARQRTRPTGATTKGSRR